MNSTNVAEDDEGSSQNQVQNRNMRGVRDDIVQNYDDPYFLTSGDTLNLSLSNYVFHGSNFVN